jgi:hypothetical protein
MNINKSGLLCFFCGEQKEIPWVLKTLTRSKKVFAKSLRQAAHRTPSAAFALRSAFVIDET